MPPPTDDALILAATERALRQVIELAPDSFGHFKLGQFLAARNRGDEAALEFRRALELQPDFPDALRHLAAVHAARRAYAEATVLLRRAIAIRPDDEQSLCDLGNALVNLRRGREAIIFLRQALRLAPQEHRLHGNLGLALAEAGFFAEAEKSFLDALALRPMSVAAHNNLAGLYLMMGRHDQAIAALDLAQALEPGNLTTPCTRAIALLASGDIEQGWAAYQRRWERPESPHRAYPQPLWAGQPLAGRSVFLYTDEGLGDRIQFIRYAALLKQRGARIICETPMPLLEIFRGIDALDEIIPLGNPPPPFDFHAPLLSLPHHFNTTLAMIPAPIPYLHAAPPRIAHWQDRLDRLITPRETRVAIAWQGNPHHQWDRFRSLPLMLFERLLAIPGIRLVSLQRGPGVEQIEPFQRFTGNRLLVPTDGTQSSPLDLADTAAILCCCDLAITVDTATAHLAGALGRTTWVLLSTVTDWRWMTGRPDSPWYPTMRLFRQRELNQWEDVMNRVAASLCDMRDRQRPSHS